MLAVGCWLLQRERCAMFRTEAQVQACADRRTLRGMKFLRENVKAKRFKKVDPDEIRIESPEECVFGMMFGDYDRGIKKLKLSQRQAIRLGFMPTNKAPYEQLNDSWRRRFQ